MSRAVNTRIGSPLSLPPFPTDYRGAGLLLHITSLPSPYGIGDVGPAAFAWVDRLHEADQTWWQALPVGPTGYGNSPYQCLSSFAGNGLLISPDSLIEDGLLRESDCEGHPEFSDCTVDHELVIPFKHGLLEKAWANFCSGACRSLRPAFEQFCHDQAHWLDDYSLFRALKAKLGGVYYLKWPQELVEREEAAIADAWRKLSSQIDQVRFAQFLLFRQGGCLKEYAHSRGLRLIGDVPFFVSPDSSDVWANPELFLLDKHRRPTVVAGVPPDYFSADGQLWGNPVYDWSALRSTSYRWCIDRLRALLAHVDVIRLDHFRAFAAAWHVPADAPTARSGDWVDGPGADFFRTLRRELGALPLLAEDLGLITPDVHVLLDEFDLPGTRVLQFAFDGDPANPHLPDNYVRNTVVYTGTHDNPTTREWFQELPADQHDNLLNYLHRSCLENSEAASALVRLAWSSRAALAIVPLQDLLNLGKQARMNVPGRAEGNWAWRCTEKMLTDAVFLSLRDLTRRTNRLGVVRNQTVRRKNMEVAS